MIEFQFVTKETKNLCVTILRFFPLEWRKVFIDILKSYGWQDLKWKKDFQFDTIKKYL